MPFVNLETAKLYVPDAFHGSLETDFTALEKQAANEISRLTGYDVPAVVGDTPKGPDGITGLFDRASSVMMAYWILSKNDSVGEILSTNLNKSYAETLKWLSTVRKPADEELSSTTGVIVGEYQEERY